MRFGFDGYDGEKKSPQTLLSRWINPRVQPELYTDTTWERVVERLERERAEAAAKADGSAEAAACAALADAYAAHAEFGRARTFATRALELNRARYGPQAPETALRSRALAAIPDFDAP
jgi:hypothetical protein